MAEDVRRLMDHLDIPRAAVMGYSMGARISAHLALAHPRRCEALLLGGLGIHLVEGVGLPLGIADAMEAPSLDVLTDPMQRMFRAFAEQTYSVPPEQVVGSTVKTKLQETDGHLQLMKLAELQSFDDREVKVQNIGLHIGRRPILAFGNSDGDLAMMRYTLSGPGRRLALLIHHDDNEREVAYDRDFRLSPLVEALDKADDYGITVVSVAKDWAEVFPPQA